MGTQDTPTAAAVDGGVEDGWTEGGEVDKVNKHIY